MVNDGSWPVAALPVAKKKKTSTLVGHGRQLAVVGNCGHQKKYRILILRQMALPESGRSAIDSLAAPGKYLHVVGDRNGAKVQPVVGKTRQVFQHESEPFSVHLRDGAECG